MSLPSLRLAPLLNMHELNADLSAWWCTQQHLQIVKRLVADFPIWALLQMQTKQQGKQ